jgi:hypothetical protein
VLSRSPNRFNLLAKDNGEVIAIYVGYFAVPTTDRVRFATYEGERETKTTAVSWKELIEKEFKLQMVAGLPIGLQRNDVRYARAEEVQKKRIPEEMARRPDRPLRNRGAISQEADEE